MLAPHRRWFTPKNVLIAVLLLNQSAILFWLLWNQIDMQRHPAMTVDPSPPCTCTRVKG